MGYAVLGVLVVFFGVVLFRTALFRPKMQPVTDVKPEEFDREKTVAPLARATSAVRSVQLSATTKTCTSSGG